jgi:hypothetical protein
MAGLSLRGIARGFDERIHRPAGGGRKTPSKQVHELVLGEPSLADEVVEKPSADGVVEGHRQAHDAPWLRQDDVAAALSGDLPARPYQARTAFQPSICGSLVT